MSLSDVINVDLITQPYNWVMVVLILWISSMALCLILA